MFKKEFYNIKNITLLSLIAALYVVLSLVLAPISFGIVQFRIAEVLVLLCFFKKEFCISLVVGCFITNLFSPFGLDILFGTLHTLISVIFILYIHFIKKEKINQTIFNKLNVTSKE